MFRFMFQASVISKSLGELPVGELELAAPGYDDLTEADGSVAFMAEVKSYPDQGMLQLRGVSLPREDWGGVLVKLVTKSGGEI